MTPNQTPPELSDVLQAVGTLQQLLKKLQATSCAKDDSQRKELETVKIAVDKMLKKMIRTKTELDDVATWKRLYQS